MKPLRKEDNKKSTSMRPSKPARLCSAPPISPSKPVLIPTRTQGDKRRIRESPASIARKASNNSGPVHDPQSVPPSVGALLAMTSLPTQRKVMPTDQSGHSLRGTSVRNLEDLDEEDIHTLSRSNPQSWDILQSPPKNLDRIPSNISNDDIISEGFPSIRSFSSDSMPSLDADIDSPGSLSNPLTPRESSTRRSRLSRHNQSYSKSQSEECAFDHPLLPKSPVLKPGHIPTPNDAEVLMPDATMPVPSSKSSFKSNLTASLRLFKSAAKSFSNLAAPTAQRDEFLTQSLLSISPQYNPERRPLPLAEPPDPALRRYLNPTPFSPADFYQLHSNDYTHLSRSHDTQCTASIQLQTYQRGRRRSEHATSPPIFVSKSLPTVNSEPSASSASTPRPREPRENSDFLRIIVMEMNMRRSGKLNDVVPGKAKISLPARQETKQSAGDERGVPRRWVGVAAR
ncbi:hypothetical protein MMC20_003243 [Loxospora ochrophaea]|nr:hypothetical protein [Loxospora ochrophaea]